MTIQDLKTYFETAEKPTFFLVDVFSWRGSYNEVAFEPSREGTREESLKQIERAIEESFVGWKGGCYTYSLNTEVHFENCHSAFTDCTADEYIIKHFGGF